MESEVVKLKMKIEMLEAKIAEQESSLKDCKNEKSENKMPLDYNVNYSLRPIKMQSLLVPKTCLEAFTEDPSLESGMYLIDPDGQGRGDDPIYAYCDMKTGKLNQ
jgi:hypothetical protein